MKTGRFFLCLMFAALVAPAALAAPSPAKWTARLEPGDVRAGETAQVVVEAKIAEPWHIYSLTQPDGGPLRTSLALDPGKALQEAGKAVQPAPHVEFDRGFKINVELYPKAVAFGLPVRVAQGASGPQTATVKVRYMACQQGTCTRPLTDELPVNFTVAAGPARPDRQAVKDTPPAQPAGYEAPTAPPPTSGAGGGGTAGMLSTQQQIEQAQKKGLLGFLAFSFVSGLLALLTPCVFPMIPITVSYFAKQKETAPGSGLKSALAYCIGIVVTFTGLGVLMSAVFGPTSLQRFATSSITNLALGLLFIVMAVNLFGGFEI
ncbi:MAG TPA: protein-disulfide reductase DsbD domain-containing protein, partial [Armatimonadota bacterium]|nr:protein-disulfide reductase DsbD domain-containing protein [Armatimonadota bacterium]